MADAAHARDLISRLEEAMNSRQLDLLDDIMVDDFARYCEATPDFDVRSRDDFKEFLRQNTLSFPDNVQRVEQVVVEGDRAGVWMTYEGTQEGPLGPFPPSGRRHLPHPRRQARGVLGHLGQRDDPGSARASSVARAGRLTAHGGPDRPRAGPHVDRAGAAVPQVFSQARGGRRRPRSRPRSRCPCYPG